MTDVLMMLAAGYLASLLVLWALWVSDRRAERREQLLAAFAGQPLGPEDDPEFVARMWSR